MTKTAPTKRTVRTISRNTAKVAGSGMYDALVTLQIPKMRPRTGGENVWLIPQNRVADLLAYLDDRNVGQLELTL